MFDRLELHYFTILAGLGATISSKNKRGVQADALQMRLRSIFDSEVPLESIVVDLGLILDRCLFNLG